MHTLTPITINGSSLSFRSYAQQVERWFYAALNGNLPFVED